jgi:hypothetical protein
MRLLAVIALALVVATHHGAPMLGHSAHAQAAPTCATGECAPHGGAAHGSDDGTSDMDMAAACMAILAMAAAVAFGLGRRLRVRLPLAAAGIRYAWRSYMTGPPAHGPPRPIRPSVLQR